MNKPTDGKNPCVTLGEVIELLGEDYNEILVLNADQKVEFDGDLGEIRRTNVEHYEQIKKVYVKEINFNDYDQYVIYLKPELKAPYSIEDFPKRTLRVVDIIHWTDHKTRFLILDGDIEKQAFVGRVEELEHDTEGNLHPLALREVEWFEPGTTNHGIPTILIYLKAS